MAASGAVMVDSCVLLDVITADQRWESWSAEQLRRSLIAGPVAINPLIYAEVAFAYERIEALEEVLPRHLYAYWPIPREAAFLAARASNCGCGRECAVSMQARSLGAGDAEPPVPACLGQAALAEAL